MRILCPAKRVKLVLLFSTSLRKPSHRKKSLARLRLPHWTKIQFKLTVIVVIVDVNDDHHGHHAHGEHEQSHEHVEQRGPVTTLADVATAPAARLALGLVRHVVYVDGGVLVVVTVAIRSGTGLVGWHEHLEFRASAFGSQQLANKIALDSWVLHLIFACSLFLPLR